MGSKGVALKNSSRRGRGVGVIKTIPSVCVCVCVCVRGGERGATKKNCNWHYLVFHFVV